MQRKTINGFEMNTLVKGLKTIVATLFLLALALGAKAQKLTVEDFHADPTDLTAKMKPKTDLNGNPCGLVKIGLVYPNAKFEGNVVSSEYKDGEWWVYMVKGSPRLTIKTGQHVPLQYEFPESIESNVTYIMTVVPYGPNPTPKPTHQYLTFQISPPNASLEVNDQSWNVEADGSAMQFVSFGTYRYKVKAPDYFAQEGTVTVDDPDNASLVRVELKPNFATVTLTVDANAEIWVNGQKKGIRTWTGALGSGTYNMECKMANHETSQSTQTITAKMDGQTISLPAPKPIYGSLNVESTPNFCKLYIDGKDMGTTPKYIPEILVGRHQVRLEKEGCVTLSKTITIEKGKPLMLKETLDTGRTVLVKTDRSGDKIYVDGDYVGETPRETQIGFGQHTVRVVRNGIKVEKEVNILESTRNGIELTFEFGRLITIYTDQPGAIITVDGSEVGSSPVKVDLPFGNHAIHAQRGKKYADKDIEVLKTGGSTEFSLILHGETVSHYVQNGVWFVTLNGSYDFMSYTPSYGFCVGMVKKVGWFVTAMSNFQFGAMKADKVADANGLVDGSYPSYSGESTRTRISAMAGLLVKLGGPVCMRIGAGYGLNQLSQSTTDGSLVKISASSYQGVDATLGLQFNLKGFTLTADAVTTNFKTIEAKVGLGYCWKRK